MKQINTSTLAKMKSGQKGRIIQIQGGTVFEEKLNALGIRNGKQIEKVSAQLMKGPVLFRCDHTQTAIGFGMASKILVEIKADN